MHLVLLEALAQGKTFEYSVIMCKGEVIVKHKNAMIVFRQNRELLYDADVCIDDKLQKRAHSVSICPDNIRELITSSLNNQLKNFEK